MPLFKDTMDLDVDGRTYPMIIRLDAPEVPTHGDEGFGCGANDFFALFAGVDLKARRQKEIEEEAQRMFASVEASFPSIKEAIREHIRQGHRSGELEMGKVSSPRFRGHLRLVLSWELS